jgi:pilus assembly protein TadC
MALEFLETFGKAFVPLKMRSNLRSYVLKAGIPEVPFKSFGVLFYVVLFLSIAIYLILYTVLKTYALGTIVAVTLTFWVLFPTIISGFVIFIIYSFLNLKIYKRTKQVEDTLPDYLQLVSTNLRSGMSFEKSLWFAIRPKFGILASEISEAAKKVMTGSDVTDALRELSEKYESPLLTRTLDLIISEIKSGGEIASVIDRIRKNMSETKELKAEMAASTVTFAIFISVIVLVIAPVLFALALQLMDVLVGITSKLGSSGGGSLGGGIDFSKASGSDPADFKVFSYIAIAVISMFAAMINSIISRGDIKGGLKFIPVYFIISIIIYAIATSLLGGLFSGL